MEDQQDPNKFTDEMTRDFLPKKEGSKYSRCRTCGFRIKSARHFTMGQHHGKIVRRIKSERRGKK
jgi:hypothetical protein